VKEYLASLDDTAWGAAGEVVPKFVSPSDPAGQWAGAHKGPAFFAYSDNYLIDVKFGVTHFFTAPQQALSKIGVSAAWRARPCAAPKRTWPLDPVGSVAVAAERDQRL
jgi:hypothetical protein